MPCAESHRRVEAYFDGELDALGAADFERHIESCDECRAMLEDLELMRTALRRDFTYERTPPALRARLMRALDDESTGDRARARAMSTSPTLTVVSSDAVTTSASAATASTVVAMPPPASANPPLTNQPAANQSAINRPGANQSAATHPGGIHPGGIHPGTNQPAGNQPAANRPSAGEAPQRAPSRPFWWGAFGGFGVAAVAAGLAFMLFKPVPPRGAVLDDLVNAHIRSLMPSHLIDVESTDRHTVKPWFAGHTDVSPAVADFAAQGFKLVGGRADYLQHQRAAVVVYQHGAHLINVFSWVPPDAQQPPRDSTANGFHIACWQTGNLNNCAVSDTGWDELKGLETLLQRVSGDEPAA